jgi:hypothetical protein
MSVAMAPVVMAPQKWASSINQPQKFQRMSKSFWPKDRCPGSGAHGGLRCKDCRWWW